MGGGDKLLERGVRGGWMKLTETGNAQVRGGPRVGQGVFGMMRQIRGRLGGRMIPCSDRAGVDGWGVGSGVGCPLGWTSDDRRRGRGGFSFKIRNNKRRILGPEWSLYEV